VGKHWPIVEDVSRGLEVDAVLIDVCEALGLVPLELKYGL
jgi:hypothetical protein